MLFLESLLPYRVKKSVELNGERLLEFSVINHDLNAFFYQQLKEESQIVFESEIYVVKNIVSKSNGNKAVEKYATCVHKFFDDGINNVKDKLHDGSITFVDFMDFVFGDTIYNDYDIKDFFRAKNIENLGRDNRISMLNRGIDHFEFEFDLQKKGDNDVKLIVANQIGDVTDIQFRYGHNVEVIDVEVDTKSLSTHIKGYGAPGIETEYTSPNVEVFGKLDAPIVEDERFKTASTLLDELKKRIIDEPRITIELTVDEFEKHINKITDKPLSVGDYISLIYEPFDDLNVFVRVIKIDTFYNSKLEVVNTILKITNDTESFLGSYLNDVSKQIEDATKGFQQNINMARNERDITISDNYIEVLTLPVIALEATNVAGHMTLVGESASQKLLDGQFTLDGEILETSVKQVMFQGFNTISVNFVITQLQEGFHSLRFYLKSEGNTFFIKQNDCTVFTAGQGLYAQLGVRLPSATVFEDVDFINPIIVDDNAMTHVENPDTHNIIEGVEFSEPISVSDVPSIIFEGIDYTTEPPAIPTGVVATTGYNAIKLDWESNETDNHLAGYNVYLDGVKQNSELILDTSFYIAGIEHTGNIEIKITSVSVWGFESTPYILEIDMSDHKQPEEVFFPLPVDVVVYGNWLITNRDNIENPVLYATNGMFVANYQNRHMQIIGGSGASRWDWIDDEWVLTDPDFTWSYSNYFTYQHAILSNYDIVDYNTEQVLFEGLKNSQVPMIEDIRDTLEIPEIPHEEGLTEYAIIDRQTYYGRTTGDIFALLVEPDAEFYWVSDASLVSNGSSVNDYPFIIASNPDTGTVERISYNLSGGSWVILSNRGTSDGLAFGASTEGVKDIYGVIYNSKPILDKNGNMLLPVRLIEGE